ncbi:MAG: metallophosphoesterase family protein [Kaistella sp.]
MALYAIGDIHGCFTALTTVFETAGIKPGDTVVFLGDYIDRGPGSKQVIDFILEHTSRYNFITLRGNHEMMMMNSRYYQNSLSSWMINGGFQTLDSYETAVDMDWQNKIPTSHWDFFHNTLEYFEQENFIFVHAGLQAGVELKHQTHDTLFWMHQYEPTAYDENKIVVCGHTPQKNGEIKNLGHTVFVDTWAFAEQWLTCLDVHSGKYWQANQKGISRSGQILLGKAP